MDVASECASGVGDVHIVDDKLAREHLHDRAVGECLRACLVVELSEYIGRNLGLLVVGALHCGRRPHCRASAQGHVYCLYLAGMYCLVVFELEFELADAVAYLLDVLYRSVAYGVDSAFLFNAKHGECSGLVYSAYCGADV